MLELKLKVPWAISTCHGNAIPNDTKSDLLYVYAGLGITTLYTFRLHDYYLVNAEIVADMFFNRTPEGAARAERCLKAMEELGILWRPYGDEYYGVDCDTFEIAEGANFVYVRLEDYQLIRKECGDMAPSVLRTYVYMMGTRTKQSGYLVGDSTQEQMAEGLGISVRTLLRHIDRLKAMNLIYVKGRAAEPGGRHQSNIYGDYRDRVAIDKARPEAFAQDRVNFMRSVSQRYGLFVSGNKKFTKKSILELFQDCKKYNGALKKGEEGRKKDLSVFDRYLQEYAETDRSAVGEDLEDLFE